MYQHPIRWPSPDQELVRQGQNLADHAAVGQRARIAGDRDHHYRVVADYEEAAERQYLAMTSDRDLEVSALPLVTMWRQALELRMKWLLGELQELHGQERHVPTHRRLAGLWRLVSPLLERASENEPPRTPQVVETMLGQLDVVDARTTDFHCPTHENGDQDLGGARHLDLSVLHEGMTALIIFFSSASDHVNHELTLKITRG